VHPVTRWGVSAPTGRLVHRVWCTEAVSEQELEPRVLAFGTGHIKDWGLGFRVQGSVLVTKERLVHPSQMLDDACGPAG